MFFLILFILAFTFLFIGLLIFGIIFLLLDQNLFVVFIIFGINNLLDVIDFLGFTCHVINVGIFPIINLI